MEDLLSCTVCCEPYHEKTRHPVLLPRCGHSFCRPCISFLVKKGCVVCPSCRLDQRVEGADNLPTEFSLLAISCAQQVTKQETCQNHNVKLSFWCKTCNVPACGECLFEDHPMTSHNVIKSTAYVEEMKESVTKITNKFMEALDGREKCFFSKIFHCTKMINDALRTITVLRKDMEEARDLMKGVKVVEGIAPTQTLSEAAKFLGLKWNLQDVNLNLKAVMGQKEITNAEEEKEKDSEVETKAKEVAESECSRTNEGEEGLAPLENGKNEEEKADDEKEKEDVDEEENLTEEEKRKRRKIQRLKDRLAAANAAAELAKLEAQEKILSKKIETIKEKKNGDENSEEGKSTDENKGKKDTTATGRDAYAAASKNLRTWQRRSRLYEPVPREPSITPEREKEPEDKSKTEDQDTDKKSDDKESEKKPGDDQEINGEKEEKEDKEEIKNKEETKEENKSKEESKLTEGSSKEDVRADTTTSSSSKEAADATTLTKSTESISSAGAEADKNESIKPERKPSTSGIKRPRGRMARNALKRAQTMDLSKKVEEQNAENSKENESENIKGLDLETSKASKNNEEGGMDNKEAEEAQANGESKEEKDEPIVEKQEVKKKEDEAEAKAEDGMFEMEPEEKERIATELMQVPSLTVCIEGIGGLMARVSWESMGLHIYCHQFQELPYDVIIKSNVLHALIPTRDPMIFLDIATEDQTLGRIYITLWGHLRRANNFLLLCLGDRGRSLRLSRLFHVLNPDCPGERLQGGDYEFNNGRGGEALIDDLEYQGKYSMPMEMGLITSASSGNRALDSQFYICTEEDLNRQFACPFGRVTVGLPVLKEAVWLVVTQQIWIQDCGVVLDCPRI